MYVQENVQLFFPSVKRALLEKDNINYNSSNNNNNNNNVQAVQF